MFIYFLLNQSAQLTQHCGGALSLAIGAGNGQLYEGQAQCNTPTSPSDNIYIGLLTYHGNLMFSTGSVMAITIDRSVLVVQGCLKIGGTFQVNYAQARSIIPVKGGGGNLPITTTIDLIRYNSLCAQSDSNFQVNLVGENNGPACPQTILTAKTIVGNNNNNVVSFQVIESDNSQNCVSVGDTSNGDNAGSSSGGGGSNSGKIAIIVVVVVIAAVLVACCAICVICVLFNVLKKGVTYI